MTTANWSSYNHTVTVSSSSGYGYGHEWWDINAQQRGANSTHSGGEQASSIKYDFGASYHFSKLLIEFLFCLIIIYILTKYGV